MRHTLYILCLVFANELCAQEIELKLETTFADPLYYCNQYSLRKTNEIGGEGFELLKTSKLRHAFYSDRPGSPFYYCGRWTISNDSIVLSISDRRLLNKYGYSQKESYRPFSILWNLRTDVKDKENRILIFKNNLLVLNDSINPNELLNMMNASLESKLDHLRQELDPDDPLYFFELDQMVKNVLLDFLYEKELFSSLQTIKTFE